MEARVEEVGEGVGEEVVCILGEEFGVEASHYGVCDFVGLNSVVWRMSAEVFGCVYHDSWHGGYNVWKPVVV
jgi:hypothetical protein